MALLDHKEDIERMYFKEGRSYQEIADKYGKTREAVRQFLNRLYPDRISGRTFRQEFRSAEREKEAAEELELRIAEAPPCVVCYEPVIRKTGGRGSNRTHSTKCSRLWSKARFLMDEDLRDRQRQSMAKSILKYEDTHLPSAVAWAHKIIEDPDSINTRTYIRRDSEARRAYEEVMRIRARKEKS